MIWVEVPKSEVYIISTHSVIALKEMPAAKGTCSPNELVPHECNVVLCETDTEQQCEMSLPPLQPKKHSELSNLMGS